MDDGDTDAEVSGGGAKRSRRSLQHAERATLRPQSASAEEARALHTLGGQLNTVARDYN
jgi:hypothetical protein